MGRNLSTYERESFIVALRKLHTGYFKEGELLNYGKRS